MVQESAGHSLSVRSVTTEGRAIEFSRSNADVLRAIQSQLAIPRRFTITLQIATSDIALSAGTTWRTTLNATVPEGGGCYVSAFTCGECPPVEWIQAARNAAMLLDGTQVGFFPLPGCDTPSAPPDDQWASPGVPRWMIACYQFAEGGFGRITLPVNWTCEDPAALSFQLIDFLIRTAHATERPTGTMRDVGFAGDPLLRSTDYDTAVDALTSSQRKIVKFLLGRKHWTQGETLKVRSGAFRKGANTSDRGVASQIDAINARWFATSIPWSIESRDNYERPAYRLNTGM